MGLSLFRFVQSKTAVNFMKQWRGPIAMFSGATSLLLATAFFFWNRPVEKYHPSGHSYIFKHYEFAWIAILIWILCLISIWNSSLTLRCLIKYYVRQARQWGSGWCYVRLSEKEASAYQMIPGKYPAKKMAKAFRYRGPERRKRA